MTSIQNRRYKASAVKYELQLAGKQFSDLLTETSSYITGSLRHVVDEENVDQYQHQDCGNKWTKLPYPPYALFSTHSETLKIYEN